MFADLFPTLFLLLLAAGVLWILWRLFKRLFRSPAQRRLEPMLQSDPESRESRREPDLRPVTTPPSTIPDAADVLALKAAIDNLAQKVSALEQRLASDRDHAPVPQPSPPVKKS
jgi:hypothetical protein